MSDLPRTSDTANQAAWRTLTDDELADRLRQRRKQLGITFSEAELVEIVRARNSTSVTEWITQVLA
jgi:hypothetical protein